MQPTVLVPRMAQPAASVGPTRFVYDGRLSELYIIFLKNVLLSIVTLGIYRFWGKTNVRRYLWSRTSLLGDRFEYTGTGKELFLSFLIVVGLLLLVFGSIFAIMHFGGIAGAIFGVIMILVAYAGLFYLYFIAQFTALRYRLTRTRWRGIRGALGGSPWKYGFIAIGWWLLSALSAGLLAPIPVFKTLEYRLNNVYFGTARASFDGNVSDVFLRFLAYYFGAAILGLIAIGIVVAILSSLGVYDGLDIVLHRMFGGPAGAPPDPVAVAKFNQVLLITVYSCLPAIGLLVLPLFCWYASFLYNYLLGHTAIAGGRFVGTVTAWRMFGYIFVNALIMILTLGFGFPWVLHRIMNFIAANVEIAGTFDTASIQQNQMPMPKRGEGLLDMLDPGII
jgi:uncharacterized membrane protein YjgN (DUF898 family)